MNARAVALLAAKLALFGCFASTCGPFSFGPGFGVVCSPAQTACAARCIDAQTDPGNCGACGVVCSLPPHTSGVAACVAGACTRSSLACVPGYSTCGHGASLAYGCTYSLTSVQACGACDHTCLASPGDVPRCIDSACEKFCSSGERRCGDACVSVTSASACGSSCAPCVSAPEHAASECTGLACRTACDAGYTARDGACVPVALRLVTPASVSRAGSRRPTFRWEKSRGIGDVTVQACADRGCVRVLDTLTTSDDHARFDTALPVGTVYWRAQAHDANGAAVTSPTWVFDAPDRNDGGDAGTRYGLDVDGDGVADVVALDPDAPDRWIVFPGSTDFGTVIAPVVVPGPFVSVSRTPTQVFRLRNAGDVDGDGFGDLLATDSERVVLVNGSPSGLSARATTLAFVPSGLVSLDAPGDLDGDGYADVGWTANGTGIRLVHGSAGGVSVRDFAAVSRTNGATVDVDGDGFLDRIETLALPAVIHFGGRGTVDARTLALPPTLSLLESALGDFNGDGRTDVLVQTYQGALSSIVCFGDAGLPWGECHRSPATAIAAESPAHSVGDVDGDGADDVVVSGIGLLFGARSGEPFTRVSMRAPTATVIGDVNGDHRDDALGDGKLYVGEATGLDMVFPIELPLLGNAAVFAE